MLSEMIQCKLVDFPDVPATERSFSKEFAKNLAQSIEIEGMHQPIVVRPSPDKPGRYQGVIGRHRHYAVSKVLKRDVIEARVITDLDDTDADMARTAENLWRNPLKKAQHLLAIQRWHEHYTAKYPHKVGSHAGHQAANKKAAKRRAAETAVDPAVDSQTPTVGLCENDPETLTNDDPADVPTFPELVSQTTGESLSSAKVTAKIATTLTPDQIEVCDQMGVGKVDMHTITKIKDRQQRDEVVNLIASGMDPKEAMAHVLQPEDGKLKLGNGRTVEVESNKDDAPAVAETDMTDEQWLETYCGDIRKLLPPDTKAKFDAGACFYRMVLNALHTFKTKTKKALSSNEESRCSLIRAVAHVCGAIHPKDWRQCGDCMGHGGRCSKCYGNGFIITMESR